MGVWHQRAKCRPVRWIKSFHSLLCWFECKQKSIPSGSISSGSSQVADSIPFSSIFIHFRHISCSPNSDTETGFNCVGGSRQSWFSLFSIILCINKDLRDRSNSGPLIIAQQAHVWCVLPEDTHVGASHTQLLTLANYSTVNSATPFSRLGAGMQPTTPLLQALNRTLCLFSVLSRGNSCLNLSQRAGLRRFSFRSTDDPKVRKLKDKSFTLSWGSARQMFSHPHPNVHDVQLECEFQEHP